MMGQSPFYYFPGPWELNNPNLHVSLLLQYQHTLRTISTYSQSQTLQSTYKLLLPPFLNITLLDS
jgi:hypothetical protein